MIKYYQYNGIIYVYPENYPAPEGMEVLTEQGYNTLKESKPVNRECIPATITMRQARLILSAYGLLPLVNASMATAPELFRIDWEYANVVERNSPVVYNLAGSLGLSDKQLDEMFLTASAL